MFSSAYLPPEKNPELQRRERRNLGRIGWALTLYLVIVTAISMAIYTGAAAFYPALTEHPYFDLFLQAVPSYLIGVPLFFGFLIGMPKKAPEKKKLGFSGWITFLSVSFCLMMAGNYIATALITTIESTAGSEITNAVDQQISNSSLAENFILLVFLAPIFEELMCRKWLMDRLLPYSETLAVLVSGLFFGLLHGNFYQFFYAFFLGSLFAYVYAKTGRIRHTIVMHMIINFTGAIITDFIGDMTSDQISAPTSINPWEIVASIYSAALLVLAITGAILLFRNLKNTSLQRTGDRWLTLGTQMKLFWSSAGTIVYCTICILLFAQSLYI